MQAKVYASIAVFAFFCFSSAYAGNNGQHYFDPNFIHSAVEHAQDLYTQCPPSECFILNFGPTAAIASAFFRSQIRDSHERGNYYAELMLNGLGDSPARLAASKEDLFSIFDKIIPSAESLHGRPIVINRVLWQGETLYTLMGLLHSYQAERRPDLRFGLFAVGNPKTNKFSSFLAKEHFAPEVVRQDDSYRSKMVHYVNWDSNDIAPVNALFQFADTLPVKFTPGAPLAAFGKSNPRPMDLQSVPYQKPPHRLLLPLIVLVRVCQHIGADLSLGSGASVVPLNRPLQ